MEKKLLNARVVGVEMGRDGLHRLLFSNGIAMDVHPMETYI